MANFLTSLQKNYTSYESNYIFTFFYSNQLLGKTSIDKLREKKCKIKHIQPKQQMANKTNNTIKSIHK